MVCLTILQFYISIGICQNRDSAIISLKKIHQADSIFVNFDECKAKRDSLAVQVLEYEIMSTKQSELILNQSKQISYQENIIDDKDAMLNNDDKELALVGKKTKRLQFHRIILSISTMLFAGLYFSK